MPSQEQVRWGGTAATRVGTSLLAVGDVLRPGQPVAMLGDQHSASSEEEDEGSSSLASGLEDWDSDQEVTDRKAPWGAAKEGWPRNPPLPRVFLLLHVTTAPEDFEHKHHTFNAPTLGDIGSRVGDAQFWGVFGNPVLGKNPPRNPPSRPGRGVPRGVPGQEPPPS